MTDQDESQKAKQQRNLPDDEGELLAPAGPPDGEPPYQMLYEETPAMLFSVDPRGKVLTCNIFGASQLGFRVEELLGTQVLNVFHHKDRDKVRRQLDRCLDRPQEHTLWEFRKVRKNRSTVWVREAARTILNDRGEPVILIACEDISGRKRVEATLEQAKAELEQLVAKQNDSLDRSEELLETIMESSPDYIMHLDLAANIRFINRTMAPISPEDAHGVSIYSFLDESEAEKVRACLDRVLHSRTEDTYDVAHHDKEGTTRFFEARVAPLVRNDEVVAFIVNSTDITARKKTAEKLEATDARFESLFHDVKDAVFFTTEDGHWRDVNPAGVELLGYTSKDELLATNVTSQCYWRKQDRERLKKELSKRGYVKDYELELKRKDGRSLVVQESSTVVRGPGGQIVGYHGILRDITQQRALEQEVKSSLELLEHQAYHDSLTDLPNRAALHRDFKRYLEHEAKPRERIGVLLIDLDRFKDVNDALGHHVGDKLLQQVGPRLKAALPAVTLKSYRLGGDEFAVILRELSTLQEAVDIAQELLAALKRPFEVEKLSLEIGASAGVSVYPEFGASSNELLRGADVAMYEAKRALSNVALYDRDSDLNTPERLAMASDLRRAIQAKELVLHYQPKVSLRTGRIVGFEALVRWRHTDLGLLLPGEFLPLAEVGDLIHPLTSWVVENALAQLRRWNDTDPGLTMAVNLSGRNLLDRRFAQRIMILIEDSGVDAHSVEFEITESVLMTDLQVAVENLRELAATGARLSIDDFGTGYSSFSYLKRFSIQSLKLDRTFVQDMLRDSQSYAIVLSTIQLASNLGLELVAEGVEDSGTGKRLQEMGCRLAQGFQYGRPRPAEDYGSTDYSSTRLTAIRGVGELSAARLLAAGIKTVGAVATAKIERLAKATRFPFIRAAAIREAAESATALRGSNTEQPEPAEAPSAAAARTEKNKPTKIKSCKSRNKAGKKADKERLGKKVTAKERKADEKGGSKGKVKTKE